MRQSSNIKCTKGAYCFVNDINSQSKSSIKVVLKKYGENNKQNLRNDISGSNQEINWQHKLSQTYAPLSTTNEGKITENIFLGFLWFHFMTLSSLNRFSTPKYVQIRNKIYPNTKHFLWITWPKDIHYCVSWPSHLNVKKIPSEMGVAPR